MINKIKDLSKVSLNPDDVLLRIKVVKKASESVILLDSVTDKDKRELGQEELVTIEALGNNVSQFNVGQIVALLKSPVNSYYIDGKSGDSITIVGAYNIGVAVNPDNYE